MLWMRKSEDLLNMFAARYAAYRRRQSTRKNGRGNEASLPRLFSAHSTTKGGPHHVRYLFPLSSGGEFSVFRAGAGVLHGADAPGVPADLPVGRGAVRHSAQRPQGSAAQPEDRPAGDAAGGPCEPRLQPRGHDHSDLSPHRQSPDAGEHPVRPCGGMHAVRRAAVVRVLQPRSHL